MQTFKKKRIAIIGLSVEGIDAATFFFHEGADVFCCERRTKEQLGEIFDSLAPLRVTFRLGESYLADIDSFDLIIRSPGVTPRLPQFLSLDNKNKRLTSLTKLFFSFCKAPIIGVTGTKGKGTTSTLIAQMLEHDGKKVWLGGNVGTPLLSVVRNIQKTNWVVLELSSFQLEDLTQSPHIAVVLKITQDHLANDDKLASNFHTTRDDYVLAKKPIVRFQKTTDVAVVNVDDDTARSFSHETKARVVWFSRTDEKAQAFIKNHAVFLRAGHTPEKICDQTSVQIRGEHNLENIAAASLVAYNAGCSLSSICHVATHFGGLEHRLEFVTTVSGVAYYNDSFSTTPETAIAAIESFTKPIVLIVGGSEKGSDFNQLGKKIANSSVKTLIVIGDMTQRIVRSVKQANYSGTLLTGATSMHEVVSSAHAHATYGDIVLLSPACASFDMFANYKERGKEFKHEVATLSSLK